MYNHEIKDFSLSTLSPFSAICEWMVSFLSVTRTVGTYHLMKTELKQVLIKTVSEGLGGGMMAHSVKLCKYEVLSSGVALGTCNPSTEGGRVSTACLVSQ